MQLVLLNSIQFRYCT